MSAAPPADDRDLLAGEHALGLLVAADLQAARELMLSDPSFAAAVGRWEQRLAPLGLEAAAVQPPPGLWAQIEAALPEPGGDRGEVVALRRQVRRWQGGAAAASAIAASLLLFVATRAGDPQSPPAAAATTGVLVASLSSEQSPTSLAVAFSATDRTLLVTPGVLRGAAGHEHELWVIPADGEPVSLGIVRTGGPQRHNIPAALAPHFHSSAQIALTVEPVGGSLSGKPTGPLVAAGELNAI